MTQEIRFGIYKLTLPTIIKRSMISCISQHWRNSRQLLLFTVKLKYTGNSLRREAAQYCHCSLVCSVSGSENVGEQDAFFHQLLHIWRNTFLTTQAFHHISRKALNNKD